MTNLIQNWYAALGFAEPHTEYDPETGTYRAPGGDAVAAAWHEHRALAKEADAIVAAHGGHVETCTPDGDRAQELDRAADAAWERYADLYAASAAEAS